MRARWEQVWPWCRRQWQLHPVETIFLITATVFGLLFLVVVPPTQAPDEMTHFHRAYQLSQGRVLSESQDQGYGDRMPADVYTGSRTLYADIPSHYDRTFNYARLPTLLKKRVNFNGPQTFVHLEGSTVYSPVPYAPQVVGIEATKLVWPSVALMYYMARLANLVVWLVLMYVAIRLWPRYKWAVFALALTPMSLSQAATVSPDALGNSLSFLLIAFVLYLVEKRKVLRRLDIVLIFAGLILLALTKPVFFVLAALGLLFSLRQLGSRTRQLLFIGGLFLAALLATGLWNSLVKSYSLGIAHYYYPGVDIDQNRQLLLVITHPLGFAHTLVTTYLSGAGDIVARSFIGKLGWIDTDLPVWLIAGVYGLIALALVGGNPREPRFKKPTRYITLGIFVLGFLATSLILYMTITGVGDRLINNVQGRYFIAFTPLLIPFLGGLLKVQDWDRIAERVFPIGYGIALTASLIVVAARFT